MRSSLLLPLVTICELSYLHLLDVAAHHDDCALDVLDPKVCLLARQVVRAQDTHLYNTTDHDTQKATKSHDMHQHKSRSVVALGLRMQAEGPPS